MDIRYRSRVLDRGSDWPVEDDVINLGIQTSGERKAELDALLAKAKARYEAMTPDEKAAEHKAQRESFIRAMQPCEHGDYDWETCPECLAKYTGK